MAHRRSGPVQQTTTAPQRPVGPSYHGAATARRTIIPKPIVKPSWRRTLHRISRSSTCLAPRRSRRALRPGPQQAPRPGARQAYRPGSSAVLMPRQTHVEPQLRPFSLLASSLTLKLDASSPARPQDPAHVRPELLGPTTRSSRPAGGAGPLIGHPTALRWGYHGVQFPRAVHSRTTLVGGGERKFD